MCPLISPLYIVKDRYYNHKISHNLFITVYITFEQQKFNHPMGNDNTKPPALKYSANYTQVQKQQHPFLGTITHLNHRIANTKHFLKVFKFATSPELSQALKRANKRKHLCQKKGSLNIIRTSEIESDKQNELCGISHYLYIVYEDYNVSLAEMIKMKLTLKQNFTEDQVLEFLRGVCNGLIFLQDNGYKNYSITKQSVVKGIKDQSGNSLFKLFDTQLARQMLPYHKILNNMPIEKGIYLAPEVLQELSSRNLDPDLALKSDIFSVGMVAMQMCLLEPMDHLYNYDRFKLDTEKLREKLANLKTYSGYLKSLLSQMLELSQQQRIGIVSLRQKLNINDNKSTTQYAYSAFGNSNVTQRTHKLSYPTHPTINRDANLIRPPVLQNGGDQKIPRVLTVDQLNYPTYQQVPVSIHTYTPDVTEHHKNLTFDQVTNRNRVTIGDVEKWPKNKSTDKVEFISSEIVEQRKRTTTVHNYPFYYPPGTKPIGAPVFRNQPPPHQYTHPSTQFVSHVNTQIRKELIHQSPEPITQTIGKVPEIQIPDNTVDRNGPPTPINNLSDSNTIVSQPLSLKPRFSDFQDSEVLTSLNRGIKKIQSKEQKTSQKEAKNEFESPTRFGKNSLYASNQSTPIRKVQALQSHGRNSFNQIIKQTEQEQNEMETNPISLQKIIEKNTIRGEAQFNGPKTYGKHHFTNGAIYEGEFDSLGNFCGNGVLYYSNGNICYSGGWVDNSFHGFGVLNNETITNNLQPTNYQNFNLNNPQAWHHYEGEFCMDKKNGFGTLFMCNGDKFSGCFVKDLIEGYGTFTSNKGDRVSGIWNQNVLKKL